MLNEISNSKSHFENLPAVDSLVVLVHIVVVVVVVIVIDAVILSLS